MRYAVLSFLCNIAIISYIQRTGINAVKQLVCDAVDIDTEQFGAVGTAWLVGYAIMQVPAGWLADRFGSRNVLFILAVVWSVLTAAIGWCTSLHSLMLLWFVMGLALAGVFPCAAKSIGAWFPDTQKATASGLLGSSTMLGNAAASLLTVWLVFEQGMSWQITYVLYGAMGIAWALLYVAAIPERTGTLAIAPPMTNADWQKMARSASLWLLCGQQFFRAGGMIFFINWFPSFLKEARHFNDYDSGFYASCVSAAALAGGVCGGFFSDWLLARTGQRRLSRQGIAVIGMTTAGVLVVITYFLDNNYLAVFLFGAGAFVATFGGVSGYTVAIELGGTRIGVVFSLMNMAGNFAAAFTNFVAGSLTQRTGNWDAALFFIAGIFAVDAICWAVLNPKEPLFPADSALSATSIRAGGPPLPQRGNDELR